MAHVPINLNLPANIREIILGSRIRGADGLNNMPDEIIEIILAFMPLRDAVKTSVLSTEWRNRWKTVPALIFGYQFDWPDSYNFYLEKLVHSALQMHHGLINKFGFQIRQDDCSIKHVMQFLPPSTAHHHFNVHEFDLGQHVVRPNLYSFENLKHLYLFRCVFNPPPGFTGCRRLVTLNFDYVKFRTAALEDFISVCVQLGSVSLIDCIWPGSFEFNVPRLKYFKFQGDFEEIRFKNTPLPCEVSLSSRYGDFKYFLFLPNLEILHLHDRILEILDLVPCQFAQRYNYLKLLDLSMPLESEQELTIALLLARRSPCLEMLHITLSATRPRADYIKFLQDHDTPDHTLDHIKNIGIAQFSGTASQIEFVKLLLKSAAGLEQIVIQLTVSAPLALVDLLFGLPRASSEVQMSVGRECCTGSD